MLDLNLQVSTHFYISYMHASRKSIVFTSSILYHIVMCVVTGNLKSVHNLFFARNSAIFQALIFTSLGGGENEGDKLHMDGGGGVVFVACGI